MPGAMPVPNAAARLSPALAAVDTSKWGVRYNQQQHQPPPLPVGKYGLYHVLEGQAKFGSDTIAAPIEL